MEKVRLNKYLASMGIGSRREIDKMVEEKKNNCQWAISKSRNKSKYQG